MIADLVFVALAFFRKPRRYPDLVDARQPLPAGISELLAAPTTLFSPAQIEQSAVELNASVAECREMVPFFIKRVLIDTPGSYYRMLGLSADADGARIKQHYHYIIRLFHPDRDAGDESWDDVYAPRINEAYNVLRNPARRREYDRQLAESSHATAPARYSGSATVPSGKARRPRRHASTPRRDAPVSTGRKKLVLAAVLLVIVGIVMVSSMSSHQPALRIDSTELSPGPRDVNAGQYASKRSETPDTATPDTATPVTAKRDTKKRMAGSKTRPALSAEENLPASSDAMNKVAEKPVLSVEETIRQRVAQATASVSAVSVSEPGEPVTEAPEKSLMEKHKPVVRPPAAQAAKTEVAETAVKAETAVLTNNPQVAGVQNTPQRKMTAITQKPASMDKPARRAAAPTVVQSAGLRAAAEPVTQQKNKAALPPVETVQILAQPKSSVRAKNPAQSPVAAPPQGDRKQANLSSQDIASAPVQSQISEQQTLLLLAVMMSSFEKGDLHRFIGLFSDDARTLEARGKAQIYALYKRRFALPERRRIIISKLSWEDKNPRERIGRGKFKIEVKRLDRKSPPFRSSSDIELGIRLTPTGLKITHLFYQGIRR